MSLLFKFFSKFTSYLTSYVRRQKLRSQGVNLGTQCVVNGVTFIGSAEVEPFCRLIGDPNIVIGKNFYMNAACHCLGNIVIGEDVMIGPKCVIWGRDHGTNLDSLMNTQAHKKADIHIGNNVWIGANVTILKGVNIGDGAVIGAGSVVTRNISSNSVAVGNPARIVKYRT